MRRNTFINIGIRVRDLIGCNNILLAQFHRAVRCGGGAEVTVLKTRSQREGRRGRGRKRFMRARGTLLQNLESEEDGHFRGSTLYTGESVTASTL